MKLCIAAFLATATCTSGFVAPAAHARLSSFSALSEPEVMADGANNDASVEEALVAEPKAMQPVEAVVETPVVEAPAAVSADPRQQVQPGRYNDLAYSLTLPFFDRPMKLDGSHAGDFGFDPLGFTEEYDIYYMQECELRHARLAMLAAVGWPMSELVAPSWMLQDGRAPSVLNGVNPLSAIAILTTFAAFGFLEYSTSLRRTTGTKLGDIHKKDMAQVWKYGVAGDYNFDPANLYSVLGDDAIGRKALREVEVAHGRYAMMGITYFAAWEALTGNPIVANNPLFHPTAVVPLAAVSYFIWSQFYQVSDVRKFPIQIEFTKDGEEMLNGVQRSMSSIDIDTAPVAKAAGVLTNAVSDLVKSVQDKTQDENGSDNDSQGDSSDGGSSMKEKGADLLKKIKDMQESV